MEHFPGSPPEAKIGDGKDKKKKHAKRANLRLPALASVENEPKNKGAKPEAASLSEAFINVLEKKREAIPDNAAKEKLPAAAKEPKPEAKADTIEPTVPSLETSEDHTEPDSTEEYEKLPSYEPEPVEFSGGEVILHLQGEKPVAERVIPLHAEEEPEAEPEPSEEPGAAIPVFTTQVEQQRQGRAEAPEPAAAGGGEVPPIEPPEIPTPAFEQPPEPPRPPAELLQPRPEDIYAPAPAPNVTPTVLGSEQLVTKKEAEDAAYYAARAGQNRGLVTGLLVGGAYEHFKHKRREKRAQKRFKQQGKQLKEARQNYTFGLQEQARADQRIETLERQLGAPGKRFENPVRPEALPKGAAEQSRPDPEEQLHVPGGHRLETSAWHSIEVDAKTGKPVENPVFEYGREYYRERAQESAPIRQRDATAGEVALAAAAGVQAPTGSTALPPVRIPDATTQGPPSAARTRDAKSSQNTTTEPAAAAGPLWPWLVALAATAVCLLLVTR
jgi:hypothetical protein